MSTPSSRASKSPAHTVRGGGEVRSRTNPAQPARGINRRLRLWRRCPPGRGPTPADFGLFPPSYLPCRCSEPPPRHFSQFSYFERLRTSTASARALRRWPKTAFARSRTVTGRVTAPPGEEVAPAMRPSQRTPPGLGTGFRVLSQGTPAAVARPPIAHSSVLSEPEPPVNADELGPRIFLSPSRPPSSGAPVNQKENMLPQRWPSNI